VDAETLILEHRWVAAAVVRQLDATIEATRLGHDDAVGVANLALVRAAGTYKSDQGRTFASWAWLKCAGAVRDAALIERRARSGLTRAEIRAGEPPRYVVSVDEDVPGEDGHTISTVGACIPGPVDVAREVEDRDEVDRMQRTIDRVLTPRDAAIVRLAMADGWRQEDIGRLFGVTAARVSQIVTKSTRTLRGALAG
jgi:RNA polymerase sigma factor (sigma-70 family)